MRITTISYGRKFNLGNYETEDIHLTAELESVDKPEEALARLMRTAHEVYKAAKDLAAKAHATGEADRKEKAIAR